MAVRLRDLPIEADRASGRYTVQDTDLLVAAGSGDKVRYEVKHPPNLDVKLIKLIENLALIANRRVETFDPLLNSVESWTMLYDFLTETYPFLLTSGVIQPLVDLDACLHDLVVGSWPGLIIHRLKVFDGGYRRAETYRELRQQGLKPRLPSKRAIRKYRDLLEARIVLAFDALREAHTDPNAKIIMIKLLKEFDIHNIDDKPHRAIDMGDVMAWRRSVREGARSLGRQFIWERLNNKLSDQFKLCKDKTKAVAFAKELLEWVRCRQPINRPEVDGIRTPIRTRIRS